MIWVISDTHFGHANIASKNCSSWKEGYRDFNSLQEMNETIVKNINKLVKEDDELLHMGDWSFGGIDNIWNFRKQLRCKNIHLILGNHDTHIANGKYINPEIINAQSLFSSVQYVKNIKTNGHNIFLSHYKHAIWEGSHKGYLHLYGHSHANAEKWEIGKSMDVGIDNAYKIFKEYRPMSLTSEVIPLLLKRDIHYVDHHNSKTNVK